MKSVRAVFVAALQRLETKAQATPFAFTEEVVLDADVNMRILLGILDLADKIVHTDLTAQVLRNAVGPQMLGNLLPNQHEYPCCVYGKCMTTVDMDETLKMDFLIQTYFIPKDAVKITLFVGTMLLGVWHVGKVRITKTR